MATKSALGSLPVRFQSEIKRGLAASASILTIAMMATPSYAQVSSDDGEDTVIAVGSRKIQQDAIVLKRENTQIVDGLSADEIGDIPALSIGEALENITGVTSHRENGGATEVSIRGLGPFLSSTVVNGRAATNGSGDRSVNFSQFPSELINKLEVFKTQDASQIEGGVAGQIQLETIKPLDFGKRRIQAEIKGNINPDQLNISDSEAGDFGFRLTGSYTDQFELGNGDIGISIGGQISDISQPEAEARQTGPTSNSRPACVISNGAFPLLLDEGEDVTGFSNNPVQDDDCDDVNGADRAFDDPEFGGQFDDSGLENDFEGFDNRINPVTGLTVDGGADFAFAPSQRSFRQNDTRDERDAVFGAIQYEPTDRLAINLDGQWSERTQSEQRSDLVFNSGRRNDTSLNIGPGGTTTTLDSLVTTPQGGILRSITDGSIEIGGGNFERVETYIGAGANVAYDLSDRLTVALDYGYSNTRRDENNQEFRLQSDITPVIEFDNVSADVPLYTLFDEEFDVNDPNNFVDRLRVRVDNDVERDNTIHSARFDVDYDLGDGFFNDFKAGVRWSQQNYLELDGGDDSGNPLAFTNGRNSFEIENDGELTINNQEVIDDSDDPLFDEDILVNIIGQTRDACLDDFQESGFLSGSRDSDQFLVTNVDDDGTIISQTNSFASLDAQCVAETAAAGLNGILDQINAFLTNPDASENTFDQAINPFSADIPDLVRETITTIDVQETTAAIYALANYSTTLDGTLPVSGNVGVRVVHTDVEATGFRPDLLVTDNDGSFSLAFGDLIEVNASNSYTEVLPSANAILEVAEDKLVRLGVFRALSRADPADLGFGRTIQIGTSDGDDEAGSINELIAGVVANGNPEIDPLTSWNFDAAFEWYPNEDTIFALGGYAKSFRGGFSNVEQNETFDVNGTDITEVVSVQQTTDDTSQLYGFELTASHAFSYLPSYLSGLGFKLSYNYATSNFEFEDSRYGDAFTTLIDGTVIQTQEGIIAPGNIPGLSENVLSAQVYYDIGDLDLSVRYKYRDQYFQPFTSDGTRLRFVDDVGVWEARAAYKLNDNFRLTAEIINFTNAQREDLAFVNDDRFQINEFGSRIFVGLRGRF